MIRNIFYNICFNRRFELALFNKLNYAPILRNLHNEQGFIYSRSFSTTNTPNNSDNETITISYGPKDTLLMLGYNIKENDLKDHIKMLEESLKLKLMSLDFYSPDIANSYSELGMVQHQSLEYINKAKENYIKSYEIWKKIKGQNSREVANVLCLLGVVFRDLGEIELSKSTLLESLSIEYEYYYVIYCYSRQLNTPESNLCSVYSLNNLANISHLQQNYKEVVHSEPSNFRHVNTMKKP
uniref:Tetratricopeptide repeat n=1 Tax=Theileria annulata TaxID=5874 RepID=A0A3B0MGX7_THEAN